MNIVKKATKFETMPAAIRQTMGMFSEQGGEKRCVGNRLFSKEKH